MGRGKKRWPKRAFPKRFASDYINTGSGVDVSKSRAYDIYKNHERTKSLGNLVQVRTTEGKNIPRSERYLFKEEGRIVEIQEPIPKTKHLSIEFKDPVTGKIISVPTPRRLSLDRKFEERAAGLKEFWTETTTKGPDRMAGFTTWNYFIVQDTYELRLYFSQERFIFVRMLPTFCQFSIVYKGKELALSKHRRGRIFWAGARQFPKEG